LDCYRFLQQTHASGQGIFDVSQCEIHRSFGG
jgi:hypothetical protein